MFNRGGITRVLGRPSILKLIYVPRRGGKKTRGSTNSANETPLYLFRHHLKVNAESGISEWQAQKGYTSGTGSADTSFACNPNLSLNVGIKKQEDWVFYAVAAVGLTLQTGVLALAGVGVWILR